MALNFKEVQAQSKLAFDKWKLLWLHNIGLNKNKITTTLKDILGNYKNNEVILFAYGPSFKENIADYKASSKFNNPDIKVGCVDKAFRPLIEAGVHVDFVLVADGQVSAEKWLYGVDTKAIANSILIANIYSSPDWSDEWVKYAGKDKIFWYLNKDNLGTHQFFFNYINYNNVIPAASNVGNSLCVMTSQILGSMKIYLYAYDYCWHASGLYYGADDHTKRTSIGHLKKINNKYIEPDIVWVSTNMDFSAKWLDDYIIYTQGLWGTEWFNCTDDGILLNGRRCKLAA